MRYSSPEITLTLSSEMTAVILAFMLLTILLGICILLFLIQINMRPRYVCSIRKTNDLKDAPPDFDGKPKTEQARIQENLKNHMRVKIGSFRWHASTSPEGHEFVGVYIRQPIGKVQRKALAAKIRKTEGFFVAPS